MKEDMFDKVLTTVSNQLRVTQIMVTEPDFCTREDNPSTVLEIMKDQNYDVMPLIENGKFARLFARFLSATFCPFSTALLYFRVSPTDFRERQFHFFGSILEIS